MLILVNLLFHYKVQEYYQILNIPLNASKNEVKIAYHKLALAFHPDVCKRPDAAERFIEINMAYQSIMQKIDCEERMKDRKAEDTNSAQEIINKWMAAERERLRKRAQQHASMSYSQFRKSKLYRSSLIFPKMLALFSLFFGLSIIFGSVYGTLNQYEVDPELISANYILSGMIVFLLGIAITTFSVSRLLPFIRRS